MYDHLLPRQLVALSSGGGRASWFFASSFFTELVRRDSTCFAFQPSEQKAQKLLDPQKRKGRKHKRSLKSRNRKLWSPRLNPWARSLPLLLGPRNQWYPNKRTPAPWGLLKVSGSQICMVRAGMDLDTNVPNAQQC